MSTHSPHHLTRTPASSLVFFQVPDSEDELLRMVPLPLHNFESPPSRPSSIFYLLTSWHSATLRQITERAEIGPNYLSKKKLCQRIYVYTGFQKWKILRTPRRRKGFRQCVSRWTLRNVQSKGVIYYDVARPRETDSSLAHPER